MISQGADLGRLQIKVETIAADLDREFKVLATQSDFLRERIDTLQTSIAAAFETQNERLDETLKLAEAAATDPFELLSKAGVQARKGLLAAFVENQVVIFPTNDVFAEDLAAQGYVKTQITPFLFGWTSPVGDGVPMGGER
jgi:hypothetical protein